MAVNPTRTIASLTRAEKNIRFGLARGLTQTAKAASAQVNRTMGQRFDRPLPFTQRASGFTPASRDTLTAWVFIKDIQARYLAIEETGGTRRPMRGSPINLPVAQRTNVYGNIPRGAIGRAKAKPDTFTASSGGRLPPGLYRRVRTGRGRARRAALKLLVAFQRLARYRPRLRFRPTVAGVVETTGRELVAKSIADAIRTAR